MANEYSATSPGAPFADEKDWQFEQLIAQNVFWARFQRAVGRENISFMQEMFAQELPHVFELHHHHGLTVEQMVGYREGEQWDEEGVTIALALLEVARDKWGSGELGFHYEPFPDAIRPLLEKPRDELSKTDRELLVGNAILRSHADQVLHRTQISLVYEAIKGLTGEARHRKLWRILRRVI